MMNKSQNHGTDKKNISVFFASDDTYLPYLEVAISSLSRHASNDYHYDIYVLTTKFSKESLNAVKNIVKPNISIHTFNITSTINKISRALSLRLRDYYSESIYYRMFIPSMFGGVERAVYLDSDIVLLDDVANLYNIDLEGNLMGVITDESVISVPVFCDYVEGYVGVSSADKYFNSGVLLMDLNAMREAKIEEKFLTLLKEVNFPTVAPDQDYLNFLCRDRVKYLPSGWNKHAIPGRDIHRDELHLLHFNMFNKPWHYDGVPYEDIFWEYADASPSRDVLLRQKAEYTDFEKTLDMEAGKKLLDAAAQILSTEPSIPRVTEGLI